MQEIIEEFLSAMDGAGLSPRSKSDIKPDNQRHDYCLSKDIKGKRKGYYKLQIEGDFAYGFFGDYREVDCVHWSSKSKQTYTDAQRKAHKEKAELQRKAQEKERNALWAAKASEARDFLLFLSDAFDHEYLKRKAIKPHGALLSEDMLVIPLGDGADNWNYQTIKPDGTKRFQKDGRKKGLWYEIKGDEPLCICEGFATGASINEATGYGVAVAFDAGNLLPCAEALRKLYPDREIIICADNDHEKPPNTGITKGREAALAIGAKFVYPEFTEGGGLTDFNDLRAASGLAEVKKQILERSAVLEGETAGEIPVPPKKVDLYNPGGEALSIEWEELLQKNKKGDINPKSITNLLVLMQYAEDLRGVFKYDSFAKRIILFRCPPWENEADFQVRNLSDFDYVRLESYMEKIYGIKSSKDKMADAIISTSQLPENTFNPAIDYFTALQWDGVPRLDTWLKLYVSDNKQDPAYLRMVGRKFLCGLAARAMTPGIKFDTMVILEGAQYAGKSYLSKMLATINGVDYFLDDFKDIESKDTLLKMQGKLVVEFAEISTMRKAEHNDLKAFLSRTKDSFRPPYGRNPIEPGRQCVFIGTTNPEGYYLKDVTGNRRYWPVSCKHRFNIEELEKIVPLLHAEAAHAVRNGEQLWLNEEEYNLAKIEQEKRVSPDIWMDKITDIIHGKDKVTTDDLMFELKIDMEKRTPQVYSRVTQTMISLGWEPARLIIGDKRPRGFKPIDKINNLIEEMEEEIPW